MNLVLAKHAEDPLRFRGTPAKFRYGCCCYSFYFSDLYGFPAGSCPFSAAFRVGFFFLSFLMFISFWLCLCLFGFSFSRRNICKIHKATGQFSLFELRTSLAILPVYSPQSPWNPQSEHQANIFSLGQGKDDSFLGQFLFCFLFIFACRVSSILCFACF